MQSSKIKLCNLIRLIVPYYKRLTNQLYNIYNKTWLKMLGVSYGKHCILHGSISFSIKKNANVSIGDDFCFLSGRTLNPLSRNIRGCICVNQGGTLKIGHHVSLSSACIWVHESIKIGNHVKIGANVILMDSDAHSLNYLDRRDNSLDMCNKRNSPIIIGDDVLIGVNSIVLKGVTIGSRSVIGAGSVVTKPIPEDCVACGNPAKVIKYLK